MYEFSNPDIRTLWAKSDLKIWDDLYWMVAFNPADSHAAFDLMQKVEPLTQYTSCIRDQHEIAVLLPENIWLPAKDSASHRDSFGPLKGITFDVPLDVEVSGYLKPAITVLADAAISVIPQCALIYDHVFVHEKALEAAVAELNKLQTFAKTLAKH